MTMHVVRFVSLSFALGACTQTNKDHCGNREGDRTCAEQDDGSHPICSSCESANNGCVAADVELAESCHAETVADTSTSNGSDPTTDPTTSASQSTTMTTDDTMTTDPVTTMTTSEDTSTSTTTEGETSSSSSTMTTDPSESSSTGPENPCGNGVIDPGEPCEGDDLQGETCESQGTASGELACSELCQFDLSGCMPLPTCGDRELNGDEQCDGDDFSVPNCDALNPGLYGSGELSCNEDCTFDTSGCCIGVGNGCNANTNCCNECVALACL
jgi:hypothetical protein